jgi:transaldolase
MGVLDGVTTNPSHIAKTGREFEELMSEIFAIVDGPISRRDGEYCRRWNHCRRTCDRRAAPERRCQGPGDNRGTQGGKPTLIRGNSYEYHALLQPAAGFPCRQGGRHLQSVRTPQGSCRRRRYTVRAPDSHDPRPIRTKILAASIRTSKEVLDCLLAGADVATMPHDVMQSLYKHLLTDAG